MCKYWHSMKKKAGKCTTKACFCRTAASSSSQSSETDKTQSQENNATACFSGLLLPPCDNCHAWSVFVLNPMTRKLPLLETAQVQKRERERERELDCYLRKSQACFLFAAAASSYNTTDISKLPTKYSFAKGTK